MVREGVLVAFDAAVCGLHVSSFERRFTNDQSINDDAQRPDVYLVGVADAALQHLGSDVVGRTADRALLLALEIEFGCKTEVAELYLHFVVNEKITKLDVTMDDSVLVQELQSAYDLVRVALDLELVQTFAPLQQFIETLVLAELEKDVDALAVFEEMCELRDVLVLDGSVNFDLTHQLLLGAAPLQRTLLDDLRRRDRLRIALHEFVTLGEAALAQKLSFDIIAVADLTVLMLDALLDDLRAHLPVLVEVGGAATRGGLSLR